MQKITWKFTRIFTLTFTWIFTQKFTRTKFTRKITHTKFMRKFTRVKFTRKSTRVKFTRKFTREFTPKFTPALRNWRFLTLLCKPQARNPKDSYISGPWVWGRPQHPSWLVAGAMIPRAAENFSMTCAWSWASLTHMKYTRKKTQILFDPTTFQKFTHYSLCKPLLAKSGTNIYHKRKHSQNAC